MGKMIGKDIVKLSNEAIWRIPTDSDLQWRLTYAPDTITDTEKMILASLIGSYQYLLFECTQKQRNAVCEEIKNIVSEVQE